MTEYDSLLQCDLLTSTSFCLQHEPYSITFILFLSREDKDDVRDIGKHDCQSFHFTLCYLMIIPKVHPQLPHSDRNSSVVLKNVAPQCMDTHITEIESICQIQ